MKLKTVNLILIMTGSLCAETLRLPDLPQWERTVSGVIEGDGALTVEPSDSEASTEKGLLGIYTIKAFPQYAGRNAKFSIDMKMKDVFKTPDGGMYAGSKIMGNYRTASGMKYVGPASKQGSADWKTYSYVFQIPEKEGVTFSLGIHGCKGKIAFRNMLLELADEFADFSTLANMGFADETEGDGKGGWSDQGPENDGSGFDFKKNAYANVPFKVIDPAKNQGKSILVFHSTHFPNGLKEAVLPVDFTGKKHLYLLHTACWAPDTGTVGTVTLTGTKGKRKTEIRIGTDVRDQWNASELKNAQIGALWANRSGGSNGIYVSRFAIPAEIGDVRSIRLEKGNSDAVWIVAGITASTENYPPERKQKFTVTEGKRFRALKRPETPQILPGSALDFSDLHTGKLERIIIGRNGHLAKESSPDTPFRFFGATIATTTKQIRVSQDDGKSKVVCEAYWKDKERISALIQQAKRLGLNMLRFHDFDTVFVENGKAVLNPEKIDFLDWCIAECAKSGIYVQIDTMATNGFSKTDWYHLEGQRRNAKFRLLFNPAMREEYRIGMKAILEHVNPYTGKALRDDPVLAVINYNNEQEFAFILQNAPYNEAWQEALPEWRKFIGDPDAQMFTRNEWNTKDGKGRKINEFITMKWREMLAWYRKTLSEDLGYKGVASLWEMTSSLHYNILRDELDFVMMHGYHAHTTQNCTAQGQGSDIGAGMKQFRTSLDARIAGRPFGINEYAAVYWNKYRYEEPFAVGAYAAFQGTDMLIRFSSPFHVVNANMIFPWITCHDPVTTASLVQTALLFARGDVQKGGRGVRLTFSEQAVAQNMNWNTAINSVQSRLGLIVKSGMELTDSRNPRRPQHNTGDLTIPLFGGAQVIESTEGFAATVESGSSAMSLPELVKLLRENKLIGKTNRTDGVYVFENSTQELYTNTEEHYMTVNTPRYQGMCGEEKTKATLKDVSIEILKTRGVVSVASLRKDRTIADADRLLVVYATNALGNNMTFTGTDMIKCLSYGGNPTLIETGKIRFTLRNRNVGKLKLYPLLMNGKRLAPLKTDISGDLLTAEIDTAAIPETPALFFELAE